MGIEVTLSRELNVIPRSLVTDYVSPETYLVSDPETGATWVYYNGDAIVELGQKRALDNVWVHPEPGYQHGRCKMIKSDGQRCKQPVRAGWTVCSYHGAGTADTPAGRPPTSGRYSKHLPTRYIQDFEELIQDPNLLSLRTEMALLDVRMGELLQRLDTTDSAAAWNRVAVATSMLAKMVSDGDLGGVADVVGLLRDAVDNHRDDSETWREIVMFIDQRRRVADVERRRIEAAKKYLTLQEANAMMAYFVSSVMKHCSSPQERARISEDLRIFAGSRAE